MNDVLIEGEPLELIEEAFRGMKARRDAAGWVSITGRLDRVPGEALMRALHRAEASLPRRIGSTREEHRAAALDEIARQFTLASGTHPARGTAQATRTLAHDKPVEQVRNATEVARERFHREPATRRLTLVPTGDGGSSPSRN